MKFEEAVKKAVQKYHSEVGRISMPKEDIDPLDSRPIFKEYEKARGKVKYSPEFFSRMEEKFSKPTEQKSERSTKPKAKKGLLDES